MHLSRTAKVVLKLLRMLWLSLKKVEIKDWSSSLLYFAYFLIDAVEEDSLDQSNQHEDSQMDHSFEDVSCPNEMDSAVDDVDEDDKEALVLHISVFWLYFSLYKFRMKLNFPRWIVIVEQKSKMIVIVEQKHNMIVSVLVTIILSVHFLTTYFQSMSLSVTKKLIPKKT